MVGHFSQPSWLASVNDGWSVWLYNLVGVIDQILRLDDLTGWTTIFMVGQLGWSDIHNSWSI